MRFLILAALAVLFSCNPERQLTKAEARLAQAGRLPAICADRFPIKDTTYIKDTLVKIDTFLSGEYIFDTLRVNDTLWQVKYKPVIIKQVKTLTKIVQVENKAKVIALNASVSQLEAQKSTLVKELGEYKAKAKSRLNWLILLCAFIFGYSIRKPLMAVIKWNLRIS